MMPCVCGDLECPTCGPRQGNQQCWVCGRFESQGCENPDHCSAESWRLDQEHQDRLSEEEEAAIEHEQLEALYAEIGGEG